MKCDQTSVFHRNWYFEFKMLLNLKAKIAFNSLNWDDLLKLEKFCFYTSHYAVEKSYIVKASVCYLKEEVFLNNSSFLSYCASFYASPRMSAINKTWKMSTFKIFYKFFNGIHPQTKHLNIKNLSESISEQAPFKCCKIYWGEWDLCQCRSLREVWVKNLSKTQVL